jgi:acyl-homoserine-lactone acylase
MVTTEDPERECRMNVGWTAPRWHGLAVVLSIALAASTLAATAVRASAAVGPAAAGREASGPDYQATIVRTGYGIPHITADDFGSLGFGYGFALASDDLCTMADGYVTVQAQRSRYFGADGTYAPIPGDTLSNLGSDVFWQSVIDRGVIPRLLAVRHGPGAIAPQVRQLISGYVAGYNHYLASVGGAAGVPDPTCRDQAWVKPITTLDAYLLIYEAADLEGQVYDADAIAVAQPPASTTASSTTASSTTASSTTASSTTASSTTAPTVTGAELSARVAAVTGARPGTDGLPSAGQLRELNGRLSGASLLADMGSNAIAVGSAGTRDHQHGLLLGNPHFVWSGPGRFYQVQLTIPGVLNVEGATFYGMPLVVIGFTPTMAWSETSSSASSTVTPYQLTLVPGHPTEYVYHGQADPMTSQTVTVLEQAPGGKLQPFRRTLWSTRYGPIIDAQHSSQLPWTATTAFALADANAGNLRMLNSFLAIDRARSTGQVRSALNRYEGAPWFDTLATDAGGRALYADILAIPDVTNAEAERCDTALGRVSFQETGVPILDGSRPSCAWGTDRDSAVTGIFGPAELPVLMRRDFTENSNDSYWMTNPRHPLTGFPTIVGQSGVDQMGAAGADLGLRTRSALHMIMGRISGTDGLGPPGFTLQDMKNLLYSDVQYGATLVQSQLVAMCRSFPHGQAPTSNGHAIAVGDSCQVLADWNGRENPGSRGAELFREFWYPDSVTPSLTGVLGLATSPWQHRFSAVNPVNTPYGLDTASKPVQEAFGDDLAALKAAHIPYDVPLSAVQYVLLDGKKIPLPGGPGDPNGDLNAIYQIGGPGSVPAYGSSYIQAVTWATGDPCPQAATVLTSSESDNPDSPHYADQTELFSRRQWVTASFCPAQVAADAVSTTVVSGS